MPAARIASLLLLFFRIAVSLTGRVSGEYRALL
jgi:hypothetical protein